VNILEDKYLETIVNTIKDAVSSAMSLYKQKNDTSFLDIAVEHIEKYIKLIEESDKKSESITEAYHTLRGMRDEIIDEIDRNSNIGRL
jgi:hypothetical protein